MLTSLWAARDFNRDNNGNFVSEIYGGGGGNISPYEPRPAYQNSIASIKSEITAGYPDKSLLITVAPRFISRAGARLAVPVGLHLDLSQAS